MIFLMGLAAIPIYLGEKRKIDKDIIDKSSVKRANQNVRGDTRQEMQEGKLGAVNREGFM
jgi:hypothetical protein